jgi:hypothetical protein
MKMSIEQRKELGNFTRMVQNSPRTVLPTLPDIGEFVAAPPTDSAEAAYRAVTGGRRTSAMNGAGTSRLRDNYNASGYASLADIPVPRDMPSMTNSNRAAFKPAPLPRDIAFREKDDPNAHLYRFRQWTDYNDVPFDKSAQAFKMSIKAKDVRAKRILKMERAPHQSGNNFLNTLYAAFLAAYQPSKDHLRQAQLMIGQVSKGIDETMADYIVRFDDLWAKIPTQSRDGEISDVELERKKQTFLSSIERSTRNAYMQQPAQNGTWEDFTEAILRIHQHRDPVSATLDAKLRLAESRARDDVMRNHAVTYLPDDPHRPSGGMHALNRGTASGSDRKDKKGRKRTHSSSDDSDGSVPHRRNRVGGGSMLDSFVTPAPSPYTLRMLEGKTSGGTTPSRKPAGEGGRKGVTNPNYKGKPENFNPEHRSGAPTAATSTNKHTTSDESSSDDDEGPLPRRKTRREDRKRAKGNISAVQSGSATGGRMDIRRAGQPADQREGAPQHSPPAHSFPAPYTPMPPVYHAYPQPPVGSPPGPPHFAPHQQVVQFQHQPGAPLSNPQGVPFQQQPGLPFCEECHLTSHNTDRCPRFPGHDNSLEAWSFYRGKGPHPNVLRDYYEGRRAPPVGFDHTRFRKPGPRLPYGTTSGPGRKTEGGGPASSTNSTPLGTRRQN